MARVYLQLTPKFASTVTNAQPYNKAPSGVVPQRRLYTDAIRASRVAFGAIWGGPRGQ